MIIQLENNISSTDEKNISEVIERSGYKATRVKTQCCTYLVCIGKKEIDLRTIGNLVGVSDIHHVSDAYKLVSRKWRVAASKVNLSDDIEIGEGTFTLMAGPCSIENEEQVVSVLDHLESNKIRIMRGGVFKPRSSPYSFRGLGIEGLKYFYSQARFRGIRIITEVMEISQIEPMYDYVDMYQIGARNTQNFNLLHELGYVDKPVMIKRGLSGTIEELLHSAEYIFSNGNERLILCERGIRTYETAYRNTLDLNAIPILKEKTHLPVIADPSHGIGLREYVETMAMASVMAGADGLIYEIHQTPEKAISDAQQTLNFEESGRLAERTRACFELRVGF